MEDNWTILNREYNKYVGTLVIDWRKVVLFEGLVDGDDDYYYKLFDLERGEYLSSCCGPIHLLKGILPDKDYNYILRTWNHHGIRKAR